MRRTLPLALVLAIAVLIPGLCRASVATVPDDFATIQSAIDIGADTVLVRPGDYSEVPQAYRGVVLLGLGDRRPRLNGLAITNPYYWLSLGWDVEGIDFTGPVTVTTTNYQARYIAISFDHCALPGGIQHDILAATGPDDIYGLSVAHCHLGGESIAMASRPGMVSDTIAGNVTFLPSEAVDIRSCWFTGGSGAALTLDRQEPSGLIEGNVIEGYQTGILVNNSNDLTIRNNVVRNMAQYGILVGGFGGTIDGNTVSRCQVGITSEFSVMEFNDNVVLHTRGIGVWLRRPDALQAERNVIGRCGDSGLLIEISSYGDLELSNNTLFENARFGMAIPYGQENRVTLRENILYANVEAGLQIGAPLRSLSLSCNDWFANGRGPIAGAAPSDSDLAVDPGFCDLASDSVGLYSDSPLVGLSACGQIGARGVGCSPPTLSSMNVASIHAGLRVQWAFLAPPPSGGWVERAEQLGGLWDSLGTAGSASGNAFLFVDAAVAPNREYHYRVAWKDRGAIVRGSPASGTWTEAGRLSSVTPSPARGEATVEWVLAHAGTTDIRVFDLSGREVATVARASYGVGRHQAQWDGSWEGRGAAPAGMYVVRISSADGTSAHRVLLLR